MSNQEYKFVCEILWGGVLIDREWAVETPIFIKESPKILLQYPLLDRSFFMEHEKSKEQIVTFDEYGNAKVSGYSLEDLKDPKLAEAVMKALHDEKMKSIEKIEKLKNEIDENQSEMEKLDEKPKNLTKIFLICLKFLGKGLSLFAKVSKIALAGVSLAAYTYLYSWKFALIIMIQLFIHEYGHIWAMKKTGIKVKGLYFLPLLGAAAVADEDFKSRYDESYIALMGPVFGLVCAFASLLVYFYTDEPMYAAAASWMALVNLFNLLPINPLDGGRVLKSITFSIGNWFGLITLILGLICSIVLTVYFKIWIFVILLLAAGLELWMEWYFVQKKITNPKPPMNRKQIFTVAGAYCFLVAVLFYFMDLTSNIPGAKLAMEMLIDK